MSTGLDIAETMRLLVIRIQLSMKTGQLPPEWGGEVFERARELANAGPGCPICEDRSSFKSVDEFCERHRRLYDSTGAA
jgi:hypothetical protein